MDKVRIISDLELSENDYRSLGAKLKSLCFFAGSENDIEDYMLSIVVYSAYSMIYGNEFASFDSIIWMILNKSQYLERMHLSMYKNVFHIYGMNTFDITGCDDLQKCQRLTARHVGVPNSDKYEYFDLISNHLDSKEVNVLYTEIYDNLPCRTKYVFGLMDEDSRRRIVLESRRLVNDVMDGELNRFELVDKFQELSISLIDRCIIWNENNKQRIRFNIN